MKLVEFDAEPCGFPKPRISSLPDSLDLSPPGKWFSDNFTQNASSRYRHYTRGRYALGEAYRLSGVGGDGALLAPAYHCLTMINPAVALGADVYPYPLRGDLSPDENQLDALLASSRTPVKALLATHFFGIVQDFGNLKKWCEKNRIVLIEDCSHVLFTQCFQAAGTGNSGRFVAASPYKFFPCENGGLLHSPETLLPDGVKTISSSLKQEFWGLISTLKKFRSKCSIPFETALIDKRLETIKTMPVINAKERIAAYPKPSYLAGLYANLESRTAALYSSRLLVKLSSIENNIRRRRQRYQQWAEAVRTLPNCHALVPDLPEDCVPYMFPLYIDCPDTHFYWLKYLGMPLWRWDNMAESSCPVASDYRLHLLHLPCHQSLSNDQMAWMISAVQKVMCQPAEGAN